MTVPTGQRLAMALVTTGALLLGMTARTAGKFFRDRAMTGLACRPDVFCRRQRETERLMPEMADPAVIHRKMRVVIPIMTNGTAGDDLLPVRRMRGMTADTGLLLVRGAMLAELIGRLLMAAATDRPGLPRLFSYHLRQMGGMTFKTIDLRHFGDMWLVAILTSHLGTVLTDMAFTAIKLRMLVRILFQQSLLVIMAGDTGRTNLSQGRQIRFLRLMRIVATGTVFESKVPPPRFYMTTTTIHG